MAKYLFVYRTPAVCAQPSPEEMQAMMEPWHQWFQKFGSAIVDGGDGLKPTGRIVKAGLVSDGPYIEVKEVIGGYSIVEAADYAGALAMAKECPVVLKGGDRSIEIRELAGYS